MLVNLQKMGHNTIKSEVEMNPESTIVAPKNHAESDGHVHGPNCQHHHHHTDLKPLKRQEPKIGRNDPCPCGSLKKYKKCCQLKLSAV